MVKSRFIEEFTNYEIQRVSISDLCSTFIDGDWIEAKDQSGSGYRLVQTGNVGVCEYIDKEEHARFVDEETFKRLNCTEIRPGDILFSRLPDPIGRCCMIPNGFPKAITAVDCTITRLKDSCLPEYLMIYTTTTMYSEQIKTCITGTTRQRISRANLAKVQVPLPAIERQQSFVDLVNQADKSKFELKQAIEKIDKVMRALMQ
jgi:type I restriction enzyme S subunit